MDDYVIYLYRTDFPSLVNIEVYIMGRTAPPEHPAHITTCISHELKDQLIETRGDQSLSTWVRVILEQWADDGMTRPRAPEGTPSPPTTDYLGNILS